MAIDWIPVSVRVPDDRREVLCWGLPVLSYMQVKFNAAPAQFLGKSRCNIGRERHLFDIERKGRWLYGCCPKVTHWAEITPPESAEYAPPPKAL